tara:strand:+ start:927 stop:1046 length:120 start_codon:yes stop_codon:yes gene_type:complete
MHLFLQVLMGTINIKWKNINIYSAFQVTFKAPIKTKRAA